MKRFLLYWLPVIVLCGIIFVQSCFATPHVLPSWPLQDKLLHAAVYGLLGASWVRAFNSLNAWRGRPWRLFAVAVTLATLYGLSDEWHQSFVPARSADGADLLADFCGSVIGSWIYVRLGLQSAGHQNRAD